MPRVSDHASTAPMATPVAVSAIPRDMTICITLRQVAPSAIRIPISRPRADTVCASSPYSPSDAMTSASKPNATSSVVC